jgi:hypothetical protein
MRFKIFSKIYYKFYLVYLFNFTIISILIIILQDQSKNGEQFGFLFAYIIPTFIFILIFNFILVIISKNTKYLKYRSINSTAFGIFVIVISLWYMILSLLKHGLTYFFKSMNDSSTLYPLIIILISYFMTFILYYIVNNKRFIDLVGKELFQKMKQNRNK